MRSIVTDRVAWSVGRSVTVVSPAKVAEPIKMPFGLRTRVGPIKGTVYWMGSRSSMGKDNFGVRGAHTSKDAENTQM